MTNVCISVCIVCLTVLKMVCHSTYLHVGVCVSVCLYGLSLWFSSLLNLSSHVSHVLFWMQKRNFITGHVGVNSKQTDKQTICRIALRGDKQHLFSSRINMFSSFWQSNWNEITLPLSLLLLFLPTLPFLFPPPSFRLLSFCFSNPFLTIFLAFLSFFPPSFPSLPS